MCDCKSRYCIAVFMHMFNESNVFILFHFYGGALIFLGGAGAPASPSPAPPMNEEMAVRIIIFIFATLTQITLVY